MIGTIRLNGATVAECNELTFYEPTPETYGEPECLTWPESGNVTVTCKVAAGDAAEFFSRLVPLQAEPAPVDLTLPASGTAAAVTLHRLRMGVVTEDLWGTAFDLDPDHETRIRTTRGGQRYGWSPLDVDCSVVVEVGG